MYVKLLLKHKKDIHVCKAFVKHKKVYMYVKLLLSIRRYTCMRSFC